MDSRISAHYDSIDEWSRFTSPHGELEFLRSKDILSRVLPAGPLEVLDVGGGPGRYSLWLKESGHRVTLVDPVAKHVDQARAAGIDAAIGDARELAAATDSADAVLLMGPLYHLPDKDDRLAAWREATRVVRPGGVVAVAAVSRFTSLHDGLRCGFDADARFRAIVEGDLAGSGHRPPAGAPGSWFTTAYFHHPDEVVEEAAVVGLRCAVHAVEGAAWLFGDEILAERLADEDARNRLLDSLRKVETERALLGVSSHLLAVARAD